MLGYLGGRSRGIAMMGAGRIWGGKARRGNDEDINVMERLEYILDYWVIVWELGMESGLYWIIGFDNN